MYFFAPQVVQELRHDSNKKLYIFPEKKFILPVNVSYFLLYKKVHFFDRPYPFRIYDGGRHEKINKTLTKFIPYNKYRIKKYFMTSFLFFIINILSAYSSMSEEYDNKSKTQIFDITESNMTLEEEFAYLAYDITDT